MASHNGEPHVEYSTYVKGMLRYLSNTVNVNWFTVKRNRNYVDSRMQIEEETQLTANRMLAKPIDIKHHFTRQAFQIC